VSRQLRRQAQREGHVEDTTSFSDAGFAPSAAWVEPMPWSFVERVVETRRFLLIYHGYAKDPFYVPTHRLSAGDLERLRAVLEKHLQSRPASMQLLRAPLEGSRRGGRRQVEQRVAAARPGGGPL
jgi:hypothetical protein